MDLSKPVISLIACVGKNRELGLGNGLIWKIPEDMAFFKHKTIGHAVVIGQRTYESIGKPLPQRTNIILSRDPDFNPKGTQIARSMKDAIRLAKVNEKEEIFFIGGGYVYSQAIKFADRIYLTLVNAEAEADTFFPDYSAFEQIAKTGGGEYNGVKYEFLIFEKNAKKTR